MSKQAHFETEREYLASKGLAKANSRGRFSADAHAALAEARKSGVTFGPLPVSEDTDSLGKSAPSVPPGTEGVSPTSSEEANEGYIFRLPQVPTEPVRKEDYAYSIDEWNHMIGHTTCGLCRARINACLCKDGPRAPKYVGTDQISYLVERAGGVV